VSVENSHYLTSASLNVSGFGIVNVRRAVVFGSAFNPMSSVALIFGMHALSIFSSMAVICLNVDL